VNIFRRYLSSLVELDLTTGTSCHGDEQRHRCYRDRRLRFDKVIERHPRSPLRSIGAFDGSGGLSSPEERRTSFYSLPCMGANSPMHGTTLALMHGTVDRQVYG